MNTFERIRSVVSGEQRNLTSALERAGGRALERRDPAGATTTLSPYSQLSKTMVSEWNADDAIRLAYYANVYVYRCVFQCAQALAGLPFRVGLDPEKPDVFDKGSKNPLAKLLSPPPGGPAPRISARKLWAWTVTQYLITGKWAWEIEGSKANGEGDIVNLWPLVSCALNPIPTKSGDAYFSGYQYGKPGANEKEIVNFGYDQVLYAWRPMATDYRQPESALMAARLNISVAVMQDRYDFAFLRNDARPAAVIVHEAFALEAEREAFKRAFRADFRGPDNAGKAMFIEADSGGNENGVAGALDIKVLGLSQHDAMFIERYSQKISDICVALGTPLSILGDSTKRTYDSANVEHRNWWEGTLQPLGSDLQDEVNMQLVPRMNMDEVGWFDYSKVVALQSDSRLLALGAIIPLVVGEGLPITVGEFRDALGLPAERPDDPINEAKLEAGQAHKQEADMTTNGRPLGTPVGGDPSKAGAAPPAGPKAAPNAEKGAPGSGAQSGKLEGEIETRASTRTREVREAEGRAIDQTIAGLEPVFEDAMKRIFSKQAQSVLTRLGGRRGRKVEKVADTAHGVDIAKTVFDPEYWQQETSADIASQYGAIIAASENSLRHGFTTKIGSTAASGSMGWTFGIQNPQAQMFIQARANQLSGRVTQTTYDAIQDAMTTGAAAGESVPQIADRIQAVFTDASESRAEMIARTEVIGAYNGASNLMIDSLPSDVCNGKEWLAEIDDRTREDHVEADGQQVAKGATFDVGDSQMQYPGDPDGSPEETINCRCKVLALTPDDWNGPDWVSRPEDENGLQGDEGTGGKHRNVDVESLRELVLWG